jgi:hypothetical protein
MNSLHSSLPNPDGSRAASWNPWPIALIAFLSLFATAVVGFGIFAIRHNQDLVRPDYYDHEIRYQDQIEREIRTRELAGRVELGLAPGSRTLEIRIPGAAQGTIHLYRPSDAALDRDVVLSTGADGRQRVDLSELKPGLWKARMSWKQGDDDYAYESTLVLP